MTPIYERFTIEERAERYQRRYTGPFRTVSHEVGPITVTTRYRRRLRIEFAELNVAGHDLWTHVIWRHGLVPVVNALARLLR